MPHKVDHRSFLSQQKINIILSHLIFERNSRIKRQIFLIVDYGGETGPFNFVLDGLLNIIYVDIYTMIKVVALVCLLLVVRVSSIKMILYLGENEGPKCFYEYLKNGEKYAFNAKGISHQKYKIDIYRQEGHKWEEVYNKKSPTSYESIHKLAQQQATHMFCISNTEQDVLKVQVEIMGGLELGSLDSLPSKGDHELLDQQIGWLQHQKQKLIKAMNRVGENQNGSEQLKKSSSKTMLIIAILGLACILSINYLFFLRAKKELKDRKFI